MAKTKHDIKIPALYEDETGAIRVVGTRILLDLIIHAFQDRAPRTDYQTLRYPLSCRCISHHWLLSL